MINFRSEKRMPAYAGFLSVGIFVVLAVLLASPSDSKNAFLFGYSLEILLINAVLLMAGSALLFLTWNLNRNPERSRRLWEGLTQRDGVRDFLLLSALTTTVLIVCILLLPSYRLGDLAGYVFRLYPLVFWLAVTGAVTTAILIFERRVAKNVASIQFPASILSPGLIVFLLLFLTLILVQTTGLGIRQPEEYWFGTGVPVLGLQVLCALTVGSLFLWLEPKLSAMQKSRLDWLLFFAAWAVSAWLWARQPLSPNYFMPDTAKNPIYPYSDGATFDTGSQYALIGQGLFNSQYFDRALYSALLTFLHIFFGQDVTRVMAAQAALFAVFPAVTYLIGKEIHGRALGVSSAVLVSLRGLNAIITAKWIDTASPKMFLTDFPTAIGVALFILFLLQWGNRPARVSWLVWAGGVFGLTLMIRTHVLVLLPVALFFIAITLRYRWKQVLLFSLALAMGWVTATLPWELRNHSKGIPMFYMYYSRIELLLRYRYGITGDASLPSTPDNPRMMQRQHALLQREEKICRSTPCSIANHFIHNFVTSVTFLPSSFTLHDLWNTVKADTPYWKQDWNEGQVGTMGAFFLILNLALFSLGIGSVWAQNRSRTLLMVFMLAAYFAVNSLGLTSGGRYIAPVDWIVCIFFMAGWMLVASHFLAWAGAVSDKVPVADDEAIVLDISHIPWLRVGLAFVAVFAVGCLLPLSERSFTPRYQVRSTVEVLDSLEQSGLLQQSGLTAEDLTAFMSDPNALMLEGRALYPRYYKEDQGEQDLSTYYRWYEYPRLVFTLIGPYSPQSQGVVIAGDRPTISLHTADVIVFGCYTKDYMPYISSVVVFVTSDGGYVYNHNPAVPLRCPLPELVK